VAYGYGYDFPEYVSAAERRRRAARKLKELAKKGLDPRPVRIEGRHIATTFWGKAWCDHLESHADLASRLPRGRTYARNGSVVDLKIARGEVRALVSGTDFYDVTVRIRPLEPARWKTVRRSCAGQIATVVELLSGTLSSAVMEVLCHRDDGLFPATRELEMTCSCPDAAWLCKHLAAVLYGVGARLDQAPELLFTLRGVEVAELVAEAGDAGALAGAAAGDAAIPDQHLADIFGIELESARPPPSPRKAKVNVRVKAKTKAKAPTKRATASAGRRKLKPASRSRRAAGARR
jgi:uncharacterized Zn finger protein